jgi:hypothetical protein
MITGSFERMLAFTLAVLNVKLLWPVLIAWMGAKLAASWLRFPMDLDRNPGRKIRTPNTDRTGREVRAGHLVAVLVGTTSLMVGVAMGVFVRIVLHKLGYASQLTIFTDG